MRYKKEWQGLSGIYSIKCKVNNKQYIGKSKNIYRRLKTHTTTLNRAVKKQENSHLIHAWKKYGEENFEFLIVEKCSINKLSKRELYYILKFNTINRKYGYNLRLDTSSGMICTAETRKKLSLGQKLRFKNMSPEEKLRLAKIGSEVWKRYSKEEINKNMTKQAISESIYKWYQYDKKGNLIKEWKCVRDILKENPFYKRHNIYAVGSGEKPSMYGYI